MDFCHNATSLPFNMLSSFVITSYQRAIILQLKMNLKIIKLAPLYIHEPILYMSFSGGASGKEPACQCRRHKGHRFDPRLWRRAWKPTPVFLPRESLEQKSLAGYSPWGHKESDRTEVTPHTCTDTIYFKFHRSLLIVTI